MYKIGIDPGITGALAILDENNELGDMADMPVMQLGSGNKQQVNGAHLARVLASWHTPGEIITAYLEAVSAMPKQGVTSVFNFGMGYGVIQGVLAAMQIPYVLVRPGEWKKRAGLVGKKKDAARTMAQQLYPAAELDRKKDIGRADAILIARFGVVPNDTQGIL